MGPVKLWRLVKLRIDALRLRFTLFKLNWMLREWVGVSKTKT